MRAACSVQHILFSPIIPITFTADYRLQLSLVCSFAGLCFCFLQNLNRFTHNSAHLVILCLQMSPWSTVCTLKQTQINTFNGDTVSLPVIRHVMSSASIGRPQTLYRLLDMDCIRSWRKCSHPFMWTWSSPNVALSHPKSFISEKHNTLWCKKKTVQMLTSGREGPAISKRLHLAPGNRVTCRLEMCGYPHGGNFVCTAHWQITAASSASLGTNKWPYKYLQYTV
jgi:hypothetical protein